MHTQTNFLQRARDLSKKQVNVVAHTGESYLLQFLLLTLTLCVGTYLYFVGLSIMNVIANKEASLESDRLQSIVSTLEEDYFTLSKDVTSALGTHIGLAETNDASFVRRVNNMAANNGNRSF